MTTRQLENRVRRLAELEAQKKELDAQIATIKKEVQEGMGEAEELETAKYIIRWKVVVNSRFDSKAFKENHKKLYLKYLNTAEGRRFTYAAKQNA